MDNFDPKPTSSTPTAGFEFNHSTIINLLYLASYVTGITGIVGVVLAYAWRSEPKEEWEHSHFDYSIRTFWIFLIGMVVGTILTIVLIGIVILIAVSVLVIVRCVLSLLNAQKHAPMPNPDTWLA